MPLSLINRYNNQIYQFIFLFFLAFGIRSFIYTLYIRPHLYYQQADSKDYHICALGIANGAGMHHLGTKEPIFWRTPGYPWYLSLFYNPGKISADFDQYTHEHNIALWLQIIFCSVTPILVWILAAILTQSTITACVAGVIFALHIGHSLASCYVLTDGLALFFFLCSLIGFFYQFYHNQYSYLLITMSACSLAIYTWARPNGIYIAVVMCILLLLSSTSLGKSIRRSIIFFMLFFLCISPWYVRNYQLTDLWFFCPMSGPYLQAFCASRILHRVTGKSLQDCLTYLHKTTHQEIIEQAILRKNASLHKIAPKEFMCMRTALPIIKRYPHYALYEWMREVIKTSFDLYTSQLVSCERKRHTYDPIQEFLTTKTYETIFDSNTSIPIKTLGLLELIFYLCCWIGFIIYTIKKLTSLVIAIKTSRLLIKDRVLITQLLLIASLLIMTGGFGYARLRLPIEPLIIILSLMFWIPLIQERLQGYEKNLRPVAI